MPEYAWMCLNKEDFDFVLNMQRFWICQSFEYGRALSFASVTQHSEYVRICVAEF